MTDKRTQLLENALAEVIDILSNSTTIWSDGRNDWIFDRLARIEKKIPDLPKIRYCELCGRPEYDHRVRHVFKAV